MLRPIVLLALALGLASGCCTCRQDAALIAREIDSVLVRTEPAAQLDPNQRRKLLADEATLRADVAALASGR